MKDYDNTISTWEDVDYSHISFLLGDEYAANLRREEMKRREEEQLFRELQLRQALDFQRNQLLDELRMTRKEFVLGLRVEAAEMDHLLQISRAFVYSYFGDRMNKAL